MGVCAWRVVILAARIDVRMVVLPMPVPLGWLPLGVWGNACHSQPPCHPAVTQPARGGPVSKLWSGPGSGCMGLGTSRAMLAAWCCSAEKLSMLRQVPWEPRVNRVTSATWRFQGGAVGALTHSILQHEQNFFTCFEVCTDVACVADICLAAC